MRRCFVFAVVLLLAVSFVVFHLAAVAQEDKGQAPQLSGKLENGIRVINIKASRYKFEPDPVVVKMGEKVRINAETTDVTHGYSLPEFKVNLIIKPSENGSAEFTADKAGTFIAHCSVYCGPGHARMHGKFIVLK